MIGTHAHNTLSVGLCREILIQFLVVEEATREVFKSARFLDGRCVLLEFIEFVLRRKKLKTSYFTEVQYHMLRVEYPITAFLDPPWL